MELTLTIDPTNPPEIREAISTLEHLLPPPAPTADIDKIIGALAAPNKYGNGRLGYLAAVAKAGDTGVPVSALLNDHFGGNYNAFGGTHASIEKTWRARGGEAIAPKLIDDTSDGISQVMIPEARESVIMLLGLLELKDKLSD